MKKWINSFFLIALLISFQALSQDIQYSMFRYAPMVTNPAQIATRNQLEVTFQHRNQWRGVDASFKSPMLTVVYPLIRLKDNQPKRWGGVAGSFLSDQQGEGLLRTTGGQLAFAYNFDVGGSKYISMAVQGGYFQRRIDDARLVSSFDPNFNPTFDEAIDNNSVTYATLGGGIMFYKEEGFPSNEKIYYLGVSAFNLNEPDVSILQNGAALQQMRLITVGGFRAYRNQKNSIVPNVRWIEQNNTRQINIGSYFNHHFSDNAGALFRYGTIGLGLWYSVENAVVASIEFNSPTFAAGFSYDFNASPLGQASGNAGATEFNITLRRTIGKPKEVRPDYDDNVPELGDITEIQEITEITEIPDENTPPEDPADTTKVVFEDVEEMNTDTTQTNTIEHPDEQTDFTYNSNDLSEVQKQELEALIEELKAKPDMVVEVRGHTCKIGSLERNQEISEKRANKVAKYLIEQGVNPQQLQVKGYNYSIPIAPNDTEEGRRRNRRVDFKRLK